jgi:uroporphyrinogen-III synthase
VAEAAASPLAGKRVVITRAALQSSELFEKLTKRGAIPILLPLVSFSAPENYAPLDAALLDWEQFDWVLFTSANAVRAVISRRIEIATQAATPSGKRPHVAVVGPATCEEAERAGFSADYLARTHLGVALAEELGERLRAQRVLLPRSDRANPDLPATLQRLGAKVTEVIAYRTLAPSDTDQERVKQAIRGQANAVLFFSPTAVHNFAELAGREQLPLLQSTLALVAIGPITAGALRESGVQRMVMAADTTTTAVVDALEEHFAGTQRHSTTGAKHS